MPNVGMIELRNAPSTVIEILKLHPRIASIIGNEKVYLAEDNKNATTKKILQVPNIAHGQASDSSCLKTDPYGWGLDRIDQRSNTLDCKPYAPISSTKAGKKVDVYVLDTGIQIDHVEFTSKSAGKVKSSWTYFEDGVDRNSHGTHVASIIGGANVGVAPKANIFSIKAIGDGGSGSYSNIVDSLDRIVSKKLKKPDRRIIVSLSISGVPYSPVDVAIERVSSTGISVVVAAGNVADDACKYSPGRSKPAITVGALNTNGSFDFRSNFGPCIDIVAPGIGILGACAGGTNDCVGTNDYILKSGTSSAAPHVSGIIALFMTQNTQSITISSQQDLIKYILQCSATKNEIKDIPKNTVNLLAYTPHINENDDQCI